MTSTLVIVRDIVKGFTGEPSVRLWSSRASLVL